MDASTIPSEFIDKTMSIPYSGTVKRSSGLISAIAKQLRLVNLKPAAKLQIQFDPFHENARSVRDFLLHITGTKVLQTNLNCIVRTNVVCDRSEPFIKISLAESRTLTLLAGNLTTLELLQLLNKHVSSTVKQEVVQETKVEKKARKR